MKSMRRPSKRTIWIASAALIAAFGFLWRAHRDPPRSSAAKNESSPPLASGDAVKAADVRAPAQSVDGTGTGAATGTGGSGSGAPPADQSGGSLGDLATLLKSATGGDWLIERDERGRPVRMTGDHLKVMREGQDTSAFLGDLTQALGFQSPPVLKRDTSTTARFAIVDYMQNYRMPDGETFPVYEAWIRFKGRVDDGAFLVINLLKPVDHIRMDVSLSDDDAIAIAKRDPALTDPNARFQVQDGVVVFADERPHQKATQVLVTGVTPNWLVLVGHETHSVIFKSVASRND